MEKKDFWLRAAVSDKLLEIANLREDFSYSDLQGIAEVEAQKVIDLVREHDKRVDCGHSWMAKTSKGCLDCAKGVLLP